MRHLKRTAKLGRTGEHRNAMLANMVCCLIKSKRITTTLAKAKVLRPVVEKLVTLGRRGNRAVEAAATADDKKKAAFIAENVHCRRLVAARVRQHARTHFIGTPTVKGKVLRAKWRENEDVVHILFDKIAPLFKTRNGATPAFSNSANAGAMLPSWPSSSLWRTRLPRPSRPPRPTPRSKRAVHPLSKSPL